MACTDNVVKNIASEISRECQSQSVTVDVKFVTYLVDLLLLNPKYGKLFSRSVNRDSLEFFVKECVSLLTHYNVSITTMKLQHTLESTYDRPERLIEKHLETITTCLQPLLLEITETYPEVEDTNEYDKLMRKISIYIILASGLGNPTFIMTLKEGMAALESVFSAADLREFVPMARGDKAWQLEQLVAIVSGCRLFNRDCKRGGEGIPDLPFNLADAGTACLNSMSSTLIRVMERVNSLTSAIDEQISIDEETQNVVVRPIPQIAQIEDYKNVFDVLTFYRQYEVILRKLLSDVKNMVNNGNMHIEKLKETFEKLHHTLNYKAAVPAAQVFPYFTNIWNLWRRMQNEMYLVSTVNHLMNELESLHDHVQMPSRSLEAMLCDKGVVSDQDPLSKAISVTHRLSLGMLPNYYGHDDSLFTKNGHLQYLGFCAMSLCVGALIPGNPRVGYIKYKGTYYNFSSPKKAYRFGMDPQRYIQEVVELARNNPCLINLLGLRDEVYRVRNVDCLIVRIEPKKKIESKEVQTVIHPIPEKIDTQYNWNLWEHKRKACQWSNIVKCQTHSTQTDYSHMRSEIQCQTFEYRDKGFQTKRDNATNVPTPNHYLWGLRGQLNDKHHTVDLTLPTTF